MKIQVLSDLHFDVENVRESVQLADDADVVIVAGDVCEGLDNGFRWLRGRFGNTVPIVTVAGNHTFYRRSVLEELQAAPQLSSQHGVQFLENDVVVIDGVRFIGCTLWTDYNLFGDGFGPIAMKAARDTMNDHKKINLQKLPWRRFRPEDAAVLHGWSRLFIEKAAADDAHLPLVIVTHHAPSIKSVAPIYKDAIISAAYASQLDEVVAASGARLWVHGHVHNSSDYLIGDTRVVCNPHGYGTENPSFIPQLVIEV